MLIAATCVLKLGAGHLGSTEHGHTSYSERLPSAPNLGATLGARLAQHGSKASRKEWAMAAQRIQQRLVALEEVLFSGCPRCREREETWPGVQSRLLARVRQFFDPEWLRAEADRLSAEADRRELLPYRGMPEGSWQRRLLEEEEEEGRRADPR